MVALDRWRRIGAIYALWRSLPTRRSRAFSKRSRAFSFYVGPSAPWCPLVGALTSVESVAQYQLGGAPIPGAFASILKVAAPLLAPAPMADHSWLGWPRPRLGGARSIATCACAYHATTALLQLPPLPQCALAQSAEEHARVHICIYIYILPGKV